jgi:hypothetical protein
MLPATTIMATTKITTSINSSGVPIPNICPSYRVAPELGTRVDRTAPAIVAVWLLASPALRALDDLEQHWPFGRPNRKNFAFEAYEFGLHSTLAANYFSAAHKDLPLKAFRNRTNAFCQSVRMV